MADTNTHDSKHFGMEENRAHQRWLLDWLENGFQIRFRKKPPICHHQNGRNMSEEHVQFISSHIQDLLAEEAIEKVSEVPKSLSPVAVIPKKSGKLRMIINLNRLDQFVVAPRFRYETMDSLVWCTPEIGRRK